MDARPEQAAASPMGAYLESLNALEKSGALQDLANLRKETRELDMLITDASALVGLGSVEEMMSFVISRFLERFVPVYLLFMAETPRAKKFNQYCFRNLKPDETKFPAEQYTIVKELFRESAKHLDIQELEDRLFDTPALEAIRRFDPDSVYPMRALGGVHGFMILGKKIVGAGYTDLERMYVDRLNRFLSIAMQNSLHHESSITDSKTGLFNHQYFMKRLEQEIERSRRHGSASGIIMMDVDHFKKFNDTWGHLAGDAVLASLAETIKDQIRKEDVGARFGGEEFCLMAVDCDKNRLLDMAERIRSAVELTKVVFEGKELAVTISLGCYLVEQTTAGTPDSLIEKADQALYEAKKTGRNRSVMYRSGLLSKAGSIRAELKIP